MMVEKKTVGKILVVFLVLAAIVGFFSWLFWPTSIDNSTKDDEKEKTTIEGSGNEYTSTQINEREYSVVHLENARTTHGWMLTTLFVLMLLVAAGAVVYQRKAARHRDRLEETVEDLKEVLIDRGYIQERKKKRKTISKKKRKNAKQIKKLKGKLKNLESSDDGEEDDDKV